MEYRIPSCHVSVIVPTGQVVAAGLPRCSFYSEGPSFICFRTSKLGCLGVENVLLGSLCGSSFGIPFLLMWNAQRWYSTVPLKVMSETVREHEPTRGILAVDRTCFPNTLGIFGTYGILDIPLSYTHISHHSHPRQSYAKLSMTLSRHRLPSDPDNEIQLPTLCDVAAVSL